MSLQKELRVVGLLVAAVLLCLSLIAMGPVGWLVFVPMLVVGIAQVHRNRARQHDSRDGELNYCPNCGSTVDFDGFDETATLEGGDEVRESAPAVNYCPDCGVSLESAVTGSDDDAAETSRFTSPRNCPDCGAPNDPERTTCTYCDTAL